MIGSADVADVPCIRDRLSPGDAARTGLAFLGQGTATAIIRFWIVLELVLVAANYAVRPFIVSPELDDWMNITHEDGLANWLGSVQTLFMGLTVAWIAYVVKRSSPWPRRMAWALAAGFFVYMAVDDGTGLHERIGTAVTQWLHGSDRADHRILAKLMDWFPVYMWNIVLGPVFVLGGLLVFWFLWGELGERRPRLLLFVGLGCYAVALVLDAADGSDRFPAAAIEVARVVEEYLEMLGTTLIWSAFLVHVGRLAAADVLPPDAATARS